MTADTHILHDHVAAEYRMDLPHRRVTNRDTIDQHVLTTIRLDELRAQVMTVAEDAVFYGHAFFGHFEQRVAIGTALYFPWPPVFVSALAVECAFAGDGNVLLVEGVY